MLLNLRSFIAAIPGTRALKRAIYDRRMVRRTYLCLPADRGKPLQHYQADAIADPLSEVPDTFVLYRIIGNDLVPRHEKGQSRKNLAFILEHEPDLAECEKRFVVNRIVDPEEECKIIGMLEEAGYSYIHVPFSWDEYRSQEWDVHGVPVEYAPYSKTFADLTPLARSQVEMRLFRQKNNYVMNNNGARNIALRDGRERARWVLPWDGNCFLTSAAWEEIRTAVISQRNVPYQIVPMARITNNWDLLDPEFKPEAVEEPQVVFRADSKAEFDTDYCYGRRPKVELFWRLGVSGKWDTWPIEPWDLPCPEYSLEAGQFAYAGWVARLFSGKENLEKQRDQKAWAGRGEARTEAIGSLLEALDAKAFDSSLKPESPIFTKGQGVFGDISPLLDCLYSASADALSRGPYSVVDKKTLPPSRDPHDYWHAAPYYWPHPLRIPGLPYVRRDGQRVPGTRLYEPQSDDYDRTRLQRLFDDTYVLALGWQAFGESAFGKHAAELVRRWFLNTETAMNPHLQYAQVRWGHNSNLGSSTGIIEFKDMYYFLDAVRILRAGSFLNSDELTHFESWLGRYLNWLCTSEQGLAERSAKNNHGTYYDLQVAAISAYLGERRLLRNTLRDSRIRLLEQFDSDGVQSRELARATSAHYCCFNLQGWIHLAQIAESAGEDLWNFTGRDGRGIRKGMEWLFSYINKPWPFEQIDKFDEDRFLPICFSYMRKYGEFALGTDYALPEISAVKPIFYPHDGVRPFWNLEVAKSSSRMPQARPEDALA